MGEFSLFIAIKHKHDENECIIICWPDEADDLVLSGKNRNEAIVGTNVDRWREEEHQLVFHLQRPGLK